MAKKEDKMAWFPLYVMLFITDIAGWNNREVGAYIRLLCYQWINKGLPTDPERLAGMVQEPISEFKKIWAIISCKFIIINYLYVNPKLEAVRGEQTAKSAKSSNAGKAAAAERWGIIMCPFSIGKQEFEPTWNKWLDYKKKTFNFTFKTTVSEQGAIDKLFNLSKGDIGIAQEIIKQSIENQWQGFFAIKGSTKSKAGFTTRQDFT